METKKQTFAQRLRWQLVLAAIAFMCAITLSFSYILLNTIDNTDARMTVLAAESFVSRLDSGQVTELPKDPSMRGFYDWQNIPKALRAPFEDIELELSEVTETSFINPYNEESYIGILPIKRENGDTIYFISEYGFEQSNQAYQEVVNSFLLEIFWLLICIFLALLVFVFWLLRKAVEPMTMLSNWAQKIKTDKGLPEANFTIQEVDDIASQLKQSVNEVTAYNDREKQFLKYASHELRTPQATIQASLDTLQLQLQGSQLKTLERALRANLTMSRLSSALLWLSRESTDPIKKEPVDIASLCQQLIAEDQHLIARKELTLTTEINANTLLIEADLLLIVFSNLLRNACQHAEQGDICIIITDDSLTIANELSDSANSSDINSFGLGLQLVSSVCDKQNWVFESKYENNKVTAKVTW